MTTHTEGVLDERDEAVAKVIELAKLVRASHTWVARSDSYVGQLCLALDELEAVERPDPIQALLDANDILRRIPYRDLMAARGHSQEEIKVLFTRIKSALRAHAEELEEAGNA